MADVIKPASSESQAEPYLNQTADIDPGETQEWLESMQYVIKSKGPERAKYLLSALEDRAKVEGVEIDMKANTPYINTISTDQQPRFPGNRELERRIKSIVRWNAMAMVVRGNKKNKGIGGHISTFASSATLMTSSTASTKPLPSERMCVVSSPPSSATTRQSATNSSRSAKQPGA